jgi:hypothetical protein
MFQTIVNVSIDWNQKNQREDFVAATEPYSSSYRADETKNIQAVKKHEE